MRALRTVCLTLAVAAAIGVRAEAQDTPSDPADPGDPVKLVRTLEFLQDTIAAGTADSNGARRKLIAFIGQRFMALDPATWEDRRNADAALLYVLNGGNPAVLQQLPQSEDDAERTQLVAAVAAYAVGSQQAARELWDAIDVESLPTGLVAAAALVKANLVMDTAPDEALHYADIARLEAPGTLVEEAATRRSIEIAAKLGRKERFAYYAGRYATRFPRSMYGGPFLQRFAESYLALEREADAETLLDDILEPLDPAERRLAYLEIARVAVLEARMPMAEQAADNALQLSEPGTPDRQRADFYRTSALALTGALPEGQEKLASLEVSNLGPEDKGLLTAVRSVVGEIERWPEVNTEPPPEPSEKLSDTGGPGIDVISKRAHDVLAAASDVLEGASE